MKSLITYERLLPDTISGERIRVISTYSSFNKAEIDKYEEWCKKYIHEGIVGEVAAVDEEEGA